MTKTEFGLLFVCVASPPTTATTRDQSSDNVESAEGSAEDAEGELILAPGPSKIVPDLVFSFMQASLTRPSLRLRRSSARYRLDPRTHMAHPHRTPPLRVHLHTPSQLRRWARSRKPRTTRRPPCRQTRSTRHPLSTIRTPTSPSATGPSSRNNHISTSISTNTSINTSTITMFSTPITLRNRQRRLHGRSPSHLLLKHTIPFTTRPRSPL